MKRLLLALIVLLLSTSCVYADGNSKREKQAKVNREEAQSIALKEVPGTVVDCDIEKRKGVLVWIIDIKPGDAKVLKKEVRVDAGSGKVLRVKDHSDHSGDD